MTTPACLRQSRFLHPLAPACRPVFSLPLTDGLIETTDADISFGIDRLRTNPAHVAADFLNNLADSLHRDECRAANRRDEIALLFTQCTH